MAGINKKYSDLALLILRIGVGVIFIVAGWGKLTGIEGVAEFFGGIGIPLPAIMAWVVATVEFFGGIMVLFGAYARVSYILLTLIMMVAIYTVTINQGFGGSRLEFMLIVVNLALFLSNSGKYSFDYIKNHGISTIKEIDTSSKTMDFHKEFEPTSSRSIVFCAIGLLLSFFLPWFQFMGVGLSGYNLAQFGSYGNLAWIVPILSGATIWFTLVGKDNRTIGLITGFVTLVTVLYGVISLSNEVGSEFIDLLGHALSIGAYLIIILSIAIIFISGSAMIPARKVETE